MPGIATHHIFGTDVYDAAARVVKDQACSLDAFLLGNQGPDPFFYLAATPGNQELRRIGSTMHRYNTVELLRAMHERFVGNATNGALSSYALGFLCHYIADSTVHPLVYAQEYAICSLGVGDLKGEWPHRVVHATIETSLDEYMLTTKLGTTAATLPPHKTMLRCPATDLLDISRAMADIVSRVYGIECPDTAFATAVTLYRTSQTALDSKSSGLRRHLDLLSLGGSAALAYVQALSHKPKPLPQTPFTNDDHTTWSHPFFEGEVVSASFDELYASAQAKASEILPSFAEKNADAIWFERIVADVNFLGSHVLHFTEIHLESKSPVSSVSDGRFS